MLMEMSLVDRVFIVLRSCGSSEIVVSVAPNNPSAIIKSILPLVLQEGVFTLFLA